MKIPFPRKLSDKQRIISTAFFFVCVVIINQIFIQVWLFQKSTDAELINKAGRQRMLSQKVNLLLYKSFHLDPSGEELSATIQEWKMNHQYLLQNHMKGSLIIKNEESIVQILTELTKCIEAIRNYSEQIEISSEEIGEIDKLLSGFLFEMDRAVSLYQKDAERKLYFLILIEFSFMVISLTIISLEYRQIFLPIYNTSIEQLRLINQKTEEVHHRVKNNFQILSSMLSLKKDENTNPEVKASINETLAKIQSIASLHELLLLENEGERVELKTYLDKLMNALLNSYTSYNSKLQIKSSVEKIDVPMEFALYIGLIINEIISNTFKYAYPNGSGVVILDTNYKDKILELTVGDEGIGITIDRFNNDNGSYGLKIIKAFVEQLDGQINLLERKGTVYHITLKIQ